MTPRSFVGIAVFIAAIPAVGHAQSQFESSKLSPGVLLQGTGLQSSKMSPGVVLQGNGFESSKLSPGVVVQGTSFQSSKMSVGVVVNVLTSGGGVIPRAPLTHW